MDQHADFFSAVAALGAIEVLDVEALRLLFRVECAGETFYEMLAERIGDAEAADLLRRNGREERGHAMRVQRALARKLGVWEPSAEDLAPYLIPLPDEIPPAILPQIVQAELDGDAGYQRWADREGDTEVQRLLRLNGREETGHGDRVRQVIAILERRPAR